LEKLTRGKEMKGEEMRVQESKGEEEEGGKSEGIPVATLEKSAFTHSTANNAVPQKSSRNDVGW
jgi:hypothetical protein